MSTDPEEPKTPEEPTEPAPEPTTEQKIDILYDAALKFNQRLQKLETGQSEFEKKMEAKIGDWLTKVENAFKASPPAQASGPTGQLEGILQNPLVKGLADQFGLGGQTGGLSELDRELLGLQKQQFTLWQRAQIKAANATLGLANHRVVG